MLALIFMGGGAATPVAPTADFVGAPLSGTVPFAVAYLDLSSGDPTGWLWDFGDGVTSTLQNPSHTYLVPGTYTAAMTATNAFGSDTKTRTNYITANTPTPASNASGSGGGGGGAMKKHHWKDVVPKAKPAYNERKSSPRVSSLAMALLLMED